MANANPVNNGYAERSYKESNYKQNDMPIEEKDDRIILGGYSFGLIEAAALRNTITIWCNAKRARESKRSRTQRD